MTSPRNIIGVGLLALATVACGGQQVTDGSPSPTAIEISSSLPEDSFAGVFLREFEERVESELADEIEIELFFGGVLGSEQDVLQGLKVGTHQATLSASGVAEINPRTAIFDLPYLFESRDDVTAMMDGPAGDLLREGFADQGMELLALWDNGYRVITNNVRPIETPADLGGLKLRTPNSAFRVAMFQTLGANPTPLSFSEVYSALDQGVIDGQENPVNVVNSALLYEVQDYLSISNHVYLPTFLLFSEQTLTSMPDDVRETLTQIAVDMGDWSREWGASNTVETLASLEERIEINEVDFEAFQQKAQPLYTSDVFIDEIGSDMIEATLASLGNTQVALEANASSTNANSRLGQ
ncbi:TRAP transporter substrate-binding protein [cf. Phormidesmis sp. LEGE 11477]|uniref:TRAP transporter substrate-binding protein n=1 Tax=cf. Phormidesmis sp. LEGE 11477 TaxID=1828680 RepID=UPI00187DF897|nr:TRAP transporter substrate-binding protein [cf. Phormidesmis sp. LEGE 11477]MBE9061054.1 TRAP transporter substrate-binding protein [cf. Phormidesmis sp. LEGE 11477]